MSISVTVQDNITSSIKRIQAQLAKLPQEAFKVFKATTPIRTGNARRNTTLNRNEIHAQYPYAKRLDEGYSKQAPHGMTKPTEDFIQNRTNEIIRKK